MNPPSVRAYVGAWVALLVLLALSCGSAYVHLGIMNSIANYGIAVAKAAVVILVFMHIGRGTPVIRVVAATALLALTLLVVLSSTDFIVRYL